ncbi:MAG: DEAD/DEAH box helicase family protein [Rhizonema sp. PD38]|nr:DEAD/DEAH box helicase family protein [Rhizonema sp. PD38]
MLNFEYKYIDNHQERKLAHILKLLIEEYKKTDLDIATSSFDIGAWVKMKEAFSKLSTLRLLIGKSTPIGWTVKHQLDLKEVPLNEEDNFQSQIDNMFYDKNSHDLIQDLINFLERSEIEVKLYGGNERPKKMFLYGNAYLFSNCGIVGSSDFTASGLDDQTELNVVIYDLTKEIRENWFNQLWKYERNNGQYKQTLINKLKNSMFGSRPYTPYDVFMKALYELFKEETKIEISDRTSLRLASFQYEAVERAIRLLERHDGCIIADAVGLGKTFIGLRLIEHYLSQHRQSDYVARALVICPAQLRDLVWNKKLDEYGINASVVSQEELGRKEFNFRKYNRYDIVVVDESHNFRNPGTNRYANLQQCQCQRPQ